MKVVYKIKYGNSQAKGSNLKNTLKIARYVLHKFKKVVILEERE